MCVCVYVYMYIYIYIFIHTYIYIYIVIDRQTVLLYCNSSVWLDMQDASSWDQNPVAFMPLGDLAAQPLGISA